MICRRKGVLKVLVIAGLVSAQLTNVLRAETAAGPFVAYASGEREHTHAKFLGEDDIVASFQASDNTDTPIAAPDCVVTAEGAALSIDVLSNDRRDGGPLTLLSVSQPGSGETTLNPNNSITFVAAEPGLQSFTYEVTDDRGGTDTAEVMVFVNPTESELNEPVLQGVDDQQLMRIAIACAGGQALEVEALEGQTITVPVPAPGQRIEVIAQPGQEINLEGGEFVSATYLVTEGGLLVLTDDGRMVYVADLVDAANSEQPPILRVAGGPAVAIDTLLANLQPIAEPAEGDVVGRLSSPESGPVHWQTFGLIMWWLSQGLDFFATEAQAAAAQPVLAWVLAQIRIATNTQVLDLASDYVEYLSRIKDEAISLEKQGAGSVSDVKLTESALMGGLLAKHEAQLQYLLAVDKHQDEFGERLEAASFPSWSELPPSELDSILRTAPEAQRFETRRQWRHMSFARDALGLHRTEVRYLGETTEIFAQEYELGIRGLADLLFIRKLLFDAELEHVKNKSRLKAAEAWLLDISKKLDQAYVQHPGWE
jgi:hypothetical protein